MGVIVVAVVCVPRRSRRCSRCAGYRTQTSPHRSANASSMTPAGDGADHRPGAGPEQAAGKGALAGIVGVRVGGCHQQQSGTDYAGNSRSLAHLLLWDSSPRQRST